MHVLVVFQQRSCQRLAMRNSSPLECCEASPCSFAGSASNLCHLQLQPVGCTIFYVSQYSVVQRCADYLPSPLNYSNGIASENNRCEGAISGSLFFHRDVQVLLLLEFSIIWSRRSIPGPKRRFWARVNLLPCVAAYPNVHDANEPPTQRSAELVYSFGSSYHLFHTLRSLRVINCCILSFW